MELEEEQRLNQQSFSGDTSEASSTDQKMALQLGVGPDQPLSSSECCMDVDNDEAEAFKVNVDGNIDNDNIDNAIDDSDSSSSKMSDLGTDAEQLETVSKLISSEQKKLSYTERNILHEELHGVAFNERQETPEMVQYALSQLSTELDALVLSDWNNSAHLSSLSEGYLLSRRGMENSIYVNKPSFRLRFLRAEQFDAKKAAIRLMKFLNLMLKTFGAFALTRPIKLTDFKRSEMKVLQAGWLQLLPFRDRSGRRVIVWTGQMGMQYDAVLRTKIQIYMLLAASKDVESQRKGIVATVFPTSSPPPSFLLMDRKNQLRGIRLCNEIEDALPFRCVACHFCITMSPARHLNLPEKILFSMISKASSAMIKRFKMHIGEAGELRRLLSTYGIPYSFIPSTDSGTIKTQEFRKWLKLQRRIDDLEAAEETFTHVDCPGSNDIVFRAGSTMIENPGNFMFRGLVESKCQEAIAIFKKELPPEKTKEEVAIEIINAIVVRRPNARFLKWNNEFGYWEVFTDMKELTSKVAVAYRDLKLKMIRKGTQYS